MNPSAVSYGGLLQDRLVKAIHVRGIGDMVLTGVVAYQNRVLHKTITVELTEDIYHDLSAL